VFHISIWRAKPTKAPCGDGTAYVIESGKQADPTQLNIYFNRAIFNTTHNFLKCGWLSTKDC